MVSSVIWPGVGAQGFAVRPFRRYGPRSGQPPRRWGILNKTGLLAAATCGFVLAGALAGCSDDEPKAAASATMIAPGRPGEPNRTITAGPTSPAPPSAADLGFVQRMVPHHQQALEMTALVPGRAAGTQVKALAERIQLSQRAEISAMQSWLRGHGLRPQGHGGHGGPGSAPMPGMATAAQLDQLRAARGTAFDRLFLTLMIKHHQGALAMAGEALQTATDVPVVEMVKETLTSQRAEISRMEDLL